MRPNPKKLWITLTLRKVGQALVLLCIGINLSMGCILGGSEEETKENEEMKAFFWVYYLVVFNRNRCLEDPNTITAVQGNSYGPFTSAQCFAFSPSTDVTVTTTTDPTNRALSVSLWDPNLSSDPENEESFVINGGQSVWFRIRCLEECNGFSVQF